MCSVHKLRYGRKEAHVILRGGELPSKLIISGVIKLYITRGRRRRIQRERQNAQNVMLNIFTATKKLSGHACEHDVDTKEAIDEKITVVGFLWSILEEEKTKI